MSSILTNASAMTALKTLQQTNKGLETTQGRISTGLRVAQASDNAAYWSIATTMRSDNKAMSTVKDALGLGAAQVDVAYTAMDAVKNTLDKIKTKLVAASQPSVDKGKIQEEIKQLQNDLKTFAESATFSGGNWLSVNGTGEQKIVASFTRDSAGSISLGTIDVDTSKTALFTGDASGLLQDGMTEVKTLDAAVIPGATPTAVVAGTTAAAHTIEGLETASAFAEGDTLSFDVAVDGGDAVKVTVTAGASGAFTADSFTDALSAAGVTGLTATYATGTVTLTKGTAAGSLAGDSVLISNLTGTEKSTTASITNFEIEDATAEDLSRYLSDVDAALGSVTTAASDLGAIKSRIASQQEFVTDLMNAVDRGVGALVDANMNEESTRLQALQVQQQLGIQALSIANGSAQSILSLFRG